VPRRLAIAGFELAGADELEPAMHQCAGTLGIARLDLG